MYVCMYVCMYMYVCIGVCVCVCVCMNACYVAGLHLVFKLRIKFQEKPEIFRFIHRQTDTNHTHTNCTHDSKRSICNFYKYMYIYIHI